MDGSTRGGEQVMAEKSLTVPQNITKEGAMVAPLDDPRTAENVTCTILSGVSGQIYTIASGKEAYLKQMLVSELSGHNNSIIQLKDKALSGLGPHFTIPSNTVVSWDPRPWECGPVLSGFSVDHTSTLCGDITLLLQIDPQRIE
jgi:hypothetical protein